MLAVLKKIQATLLFLLKATTYIMLLVIFFYIFSRDPRLNHILFPTRTSAVTLVTFVVVGFLTLKVYGSYSIGERKSRPIIYSMAIAVFLTDLSSYLMLSIMNTNPNFNKTFTLTAWPLFIVVFILQLCFIYVMTHLGNALYFYINEPERVIIVTDHDQANLKHLIQALNHFKKQYTITEILSSQQWNRQSFERCDCFFLYEVEVDARKIIIEDCYRFNKKVIFNPDIHDVIEMSAKQFILDDMLMVEATNQGMNIEQRFIKRLSDIIISMAGIILTLPIWLIFAALIYHEDKGPIFYRQKRLTRDGAPFYIIKFRSMRVDADKRSATQDDNRITKIGHIMRKLRLDELPQLLNIVAGDMSIVGPRPEMIENIREYTKTFPDFNLRLKFKSGLTGYAQIAGRYDTCAKDKLILDLKYIENYSFLNDIKIMFQTLTVFFKKDSTQGFAEPDDPKH